MFPVIQVGKLAIQTPGLLIILGLYLGISLAEHFLPKEKISVNQFYAIIFIGFGVGIIGARFFFIIQNIKLFSSSPLNVFSLDGDLLDPFAGVILAGISILVYGYRNKLQFWSTLDLFTPVMAVFAIFLGLSHLASGKAYGVPTSLPWGIDLWGENRHPSQLYETIAALLIFLVLWRRYGRQGVPGIAFLLFISSTARVHLFLDAWRGDGMILVVGIRLQQLLAWLVMTMGLFFLDRQMQTRDATG